MLLALAACGSVDPAPEELDQLAHWFWSGYDTADDVELAVAVARLDGLTPDLAEPLRGSLTDLSVAEQATVALDHPADPAAAAGMVVVDRLACTLDQVERLAYAPDQDQLHEGVYESYDRVFTSDFDAYAARATPTLTWDAAIGANVLGNAYVADTRGGLRWSPEDPAAPFGPLLAARAFLSTPATFESDAASFDQDYEVEVFYERTPGSVVHAWFVWRQMVYGGGLDTDDADVVAGILSKLVEWDQATAEACAEGA